VLAAVMAHGCKLGVYTMAQLTSNVTYEQLKRIGDWHLTEEAQRSALAELVSAITDLDTSARWGQGKTAASDGQRFSLPRRVLQQTYSTRFSDFALEFYTFVADNYHPEVVSTPESGLILSFSKIWAAPCSTKLRLCERHNQHQQCIIFISDELDNQTNSARTGAFPRLASSNHYALGVFWIEPQR
jgi:hypothetical protein